MTEVARLGAVSIRWTPLVQSALRNARCIALENGYARLASSWQQWRQGERIDYEVQLKEATGDVLFFAGIPESIIIDATDLVRTPVDGYRVVFANTAGLRYRAQSFIDDPARSITREAATPRSSVARSLPRHARASILA